MESQIISPSLCYLGDIPLAGDMGISIAMQENILISLSNSVNMVVQTWILTISGPLFALSD